MRSSARSWSLSSATRSALPKPAIVTARQPSVICRSATPAPSSLTTMPLPYSTVLRGGGPAACAPVGNALNALDIAITTGSTVLCTPRSYGELRNLLQAPPPRQHEKVRLDHAVFDGAAARLLLLPPGPFRRARASFITPP